MKFKDVFVVVFMWISILVVIGISLDKRWGSPYSLVIPLLFFLFSLRELLNLGKSKNDNNKSQPPRTRITPRTKDSYTITEEELINDLNEGRD